MFLWDSWIKTDDKLCVIISIIHFHEFLYTTRRTKTCVYCFFETQSQTDDKLCVIVSIIHFHEFPDTTTKTTTCVYCFFETLCVLSLPWHTTETCVYCYWDQNRQQSILVYTSMSSLIQQQRQKLVFIVSLRLWNQNRRQTVCYY